ncbi:alpha/beta hydrolase [Brevibacillus sp. SYP-B805]|uniref:alpha/beta fold hydrolase n=1 Tax=Brevibacillus sp. SYP-B805 TaxID=1578199 RepID=UPI0013EB1DC2|nr:alpha/beta hydrolase [Brevibacillus sp. SYP-B805]NGQ96627.1 alpha/beta hydrolase [Brevibacillus sp. SYP-B805]
MYCHLEQVSVHYEVRGEGRPILLIHGFGPDHRLMMGCFEPLFASRPGWRRIYLDLPGMGKTKGEAWINSSDDMLDVVLRFIDAVIPEERFLVAGESYGGYLARGIVYRRPEQVNGLALICPAIEPESSKRDVPAHQVFDQDEALLAELTPAEREEFASVAVVQDRYNWERFNEEIYAGLQLADEAFLQKIKRRYAFSVDVDALSEPFAKPALFLMGRQDRFVGYRDAWRILENYPRASFAVLDRAGHNLQVEQQRLFDELVGEWLERVQKETR